MEAWVLSNMDLLLALVLLVLVKLRDTAWGADQTAALDAVTTAIEGTDAKEVKRVVRRLQEDLPGGARRALEASVSRADVQKVSTEVGRRAWRWLAGRRGPRPAA